MALTAYGPDGGVGDPFPDWDGPEDGHIGDPPDGDPWEDPFGEPRGGLFEIGGESDEDDRDLAGFLGGLEGDDADELARFLGSIWGMSGS